MSASNTYLDLNLIALNIATIASWAFLPGRKPNEFGSKRASHSGSNASLTTACSARSYMVGIESGLFSTSEPGFGIHTLRVGAAFLPNFSDFTKIRRAAGDRLFCPSTPAVFLPRLSCVTLRTAKHLADQECNKVFWSFRTALTSPRCEAL